MNKVRSIAYVLLQLLITPPYAFLSLATFCLPRKGRILVPFAENRCAHADQR